MKSFLRENPTIAFGLGLPLLLVVLFLLVSGLPSLFVAAPKYDELYATGYHNYQNTVQMSVVDQKVQIIHHANRSDQRPQLWRYEPSTGAVREIGIILPIEKNSDRDMPEPEQTTIIAMPELAGVTVDSSSIAPDGYEFSASMDRYSRNVFGGMFYSSRYRNQAVLTKNGRRIRLPNAGNRSYYGNTQFIGWVIAE